MKVLPCGIKNKKLALNKNGFSLLFGVIIIGAVGLAVTFALASITLGAHQTSQAYWQSNAARALATACAEVALEQVQNNGNFSGDGSETLSGGTCNYSVAITGGTTRRITANSTVANMTRKMAITLDQLEPQLRVSSWQEVP